MIEVQMTQIVRMVCDKCGAVGSRWKKRFTDVEPEAVGNGFVVTWWQDQGCLRELQLCGPCNLKALESINWSKDCESIIAKHA